MAKPAPQNRGGNGAGAGGILIKGGVGGTSSTVHSARLEARFGELAVHDLALLPLAQLLDTSDGVTGELHTTAVTA